MTAVRRARVVVRVAGLGVLVEMGLAVSVGWRASGSFGCVSRALLRETSLRMTDSWEGGRTGFFAAKFFRVRDLLRRRVRTVAAVRSRRVRARRLMVWLTALWAASAVRFGW